MPSLAMKSKVEESARHAPAAQDSQARAALMASDIHKSYGSHQVLTGVSLRAVPGDVISIIGSSGSGKSTFLRCMNFLEQPDAGQIVVNGEQVRMHTGKDGKRRVTDARQLRQIRTRLAMVFQHFNLWSHMTVLQNVTEAPQHVLGVKKKEAQEWAAHCLNKVGLTQQAMSAYPAHLSGGQQQRVAIARALAMRPDVLLFDEPTSALDPELVGEVLKVMQQLAAEGRTMVVVTHEMGFARSVSTQVMFLHKGKVEETGAGETLFSNPQSPRLQQFLSSNLK